MSIEDIPAFPIPASDGHHPANHGMTLRDYFAAKAMEALILNGETLSPEVPLSVRAYEIADAMLKTRNLTEPSEGI